jgi:1-acyl-sn-glycerol-3-phosphate acyltransferase
MGIHNIEKHSVRYSILKVWVDFWHNKVFYRNVEILNKDRIPMRGHLIFTPNHQNALMDALALLCNIDRRAVFLARSDIFKKPLVASILYFLKILPIYRIRDGYKSLKKNKEIFKKTTDVLADNNSALVILPEGNHAGLRRLRPLKKGFARIAFQTEEAKNYNLNIQIVPVGINYEDYRKFRTKLSINFGKPISVSDYYDSYKVSQAIAINEIKDELASRMSSLIVHIESEKYYSLFNYVRMLYANASERSGKYTLKYQQRIVAKLQNTLDQEPGNIEELDIIVKIYQKKLAELKINEFDIVTKKSMSPLFLKSLLLITTLPLFIYGLINNIFPYKLTKWAEGKIKDPQFKSSFSFVVSLLAFPIFSILQTVLLMFFIPNWYWVLTYFISIPISGIFAWYYKVWLIKIFNDWRIYLLFIKKKEQIQGIIKDYQNIIQVLRVFIEK